MKAIDRNAPRRKLRLSSMLQPASIFYSRTTAIADISGRITRDGYTDPSSTIPPLRPDEVLYRARNAPTRYEENDNYFAHKDLPLDLELPGSDLLQALHAYISEFYGRSEEMVNQKVWRSMDETALIALGILLEESAREVLGETGDLAFVEGATEGEMKEMTAGSANRNGGGRWTSDEDPGDGNEADDDGDDDDDEERSTTSSSASSSYSSDTE